ELPADIDAMSDVMAKLESIRRHSGVLVGLAGSLEEMATKPTAISPGIVAPAQDAPILTGDTIPEVDGDLVCRIVSSGNVHRALPGTRSICTAVASRIVGTVVYRAARPVEDPTADVRIIQPSGVIALAADVIEKDGEKFAKSATIYRTQRRLFEGFVFVPAAKVPNYAGRQQQASAAE
ncbi:MAG: PrpF domain-containing protein, partial [Pseudomonadota bacterium]